MKPGARKYASASCRIRYTMLVPANLRGRLREVFSVVAGQPGRGHGGALMQQVCQEADKGRVVLMLLADDERLAAWYGRFGFEAIQASPIVMRRVPQ